MVRFLLILSLVLTSKNVFSNSCCGQSPANFSVLSLDQVLSVTTTYSYVQSQGRVFNNPKEFHVWDNKQREIQVLKISLASTLKSRHQVFVAASVQQGQYRDSLESGSSQHLSDTQMGYSFEVLPEYSFSPWRPIVYLSVLTNIPTGKSIYDDNSLSEGTDVTGHNQWGVGLGVTLKKVYFPLTLTLQVKTLKIFSKSFNDLQVSNFYDSSMAFLSNYATPFWQLSLNFGLTINHLSQRSIRPANTSSGVIQNTTVLIGLQRLFGEVWSVGLNYADQTIVGRARNSVLNKTYSFSLNYNYF